MHLPSEILIVKLSSLGDVLQSLPVVDYLHAQYPHAAIDWAVESPWQDVVSAHPGVRRVLPMDVRSLSFYLSVKKLRSLQYDMVFDLQGNCKSGLVTALARSKHKIGFGRQSVREWPNLLTTHHHYEVFKGQNIRLQYIDLVKQHCRSDLPFAFSKWKFPLKEIEKSSLDRILMGLDTQKTWIMVCPGSRWNNKQLSFSQWLSLLMDKQNDSSSLFFLVWGSEKERVLCQNLAKALEDSVVVDKLSLASWQNLMWEMDLLLAVDSAALHLCATTDTASVSFFGPTSSTVFMPLGEDHRSIQGQCPYHCQFIKQCPKLRNCPTGDCIKQSILIDRN